MTERRDIRSASKEHVGFDNSYYRGIVPLLHGLEKYMRRTKIEMSGSFPDTGPALVVSNHPSTESVILLPYAVMERSRRPTHMVVRDTLLDPTIKEEDFVLERTGKKKDVFNGSNGDVSLIRGVVSRIVQEGANPIAVRRGKPSRDFFTEVSNRFDSKGIVGMFIQETRTPEDDLRNARQGAAMIMRQNPGVPTYVMAMTNVGIDKNPKTWMRTPHVSISGPIYAQDFSSNGVLKTNNIHDGLVDEMEELLLRKIPEVQRLRSEPTELAAD